MQIGKLIKAKSTVMKLSQEKLPARLSYKMMKFVRCVEPDEAFYNEKMRGIIEAYCEKDKDGNFVHENGGLKIFKEYVNECNKAIADLESLDVCAPEITFSVAEFADMQMTMQDMMDISDFITE